MAGVLVLGAGAHRLGVGHDDDRVAYVAGHVAEDRDLARVGDAAGLDDDLLGRVVDVAQAGERGDEVAADPAADAAVRERQHLPSRDATSSASMLIAPKSLTSTARRRSPASRRTWLSSVVLPAPR